MKRIKKQKKIGFVESIIFIIIFIPSYFLSLIYAGIIGGISFFVFLYLNIYIHELGHVLAGKLVKFKIRSIIIGDGKLLLTKKIGGITFHLKKGMSGYTIATIKTRKFIRLRKMFFVLGGLLMNLLFVLFSMTFNSNILKVFVFSNIYLIINNLFPMNIYRNGNRISNDGLSLLKIPFMKDKVINEYIAGHEMYEAFDLFNKKEYESAQKILSDCMVRLPKSEILYINYALCLIKCLKLTDAKEVLINLINEKNGNEYDYAIYNNLAWVYLLTNKAELLLEAKKYSELAMKLKPDLPYIQGTRADILIESGDYDEGINILENKLKSLKESDDLSDNITDFLFLAYAYYQKGDRVNIEKYLGHLNKYLHKSEQDDILLYKMIREKTANFKYLDDPELTISG